MTLGKVDSTGTEAVMGAAEANHSRQNMWGECPEKDHAEFKGLKEGNWRRRLPGKYDELEERIKKR